MGICVSELRQFVVKPTLEYLDSYSMAAEDLLVGTAAQESELGFHLNADCSPGVGYGIYRITEQEHLDVWDKYLVQYPELASQVRGLASQHEFLKHPHLELATNLSYATAIAWMIYQSKGIEKRLQSSATDLGELAECWLDLFDHNALTSKSPTKFMENYQKFVLKNKGELAA